MKYSCFRLGVSFVCFAVTVATARADLLVLEQGGAGGSGRVLRVDPASGALGQPFGHENEGMTAMAAAAQGQEIFVTSDVLGDDTIYAFDRSGRYRGQIVSWVPQAQFGNVARGPDGEFYSTMFDLASGRREIVRLNGGSPIPFATPGAGGLESPEAITFGPDGRLYVADSTVGIARFDVATGQFLDVFVPLGRGDLADIARMVFGPDGRLYVASRTANTVLRFEGGTGQFVDMFVSSASGGLSNPVGLAFDPAGNLYVTSRDTREVLEYASNTGAFLRVAYAASAPAVLGDLAFTTSLVAQAGGRTRQSDRYLR